MNNFDEMSDYEINKKLALLIGMLVKPFDDNSKLGMNTRYHEMYPNTIWAAKTDDNGKQSDSWEQIVFTGEWADIGPLIEEHDITLKSPLHSCHMVWEASTIEPLYDVHISCDDSNPKRAAAICIIKLIEAKNEQS